MKQKSKFTTMVLAMLVIAGCGNVPRGDVVNINYYGSINSTPEFHMEGYLASEGGIPEQDVFHNVRLQLYSTEGELIHSEQLGNLQSDHGRVNVSVSTETIPRYVVFISPDFWQEPMSVPYYSRQDGNYSLQEAVSENDLPVTIAE